jgi:hypothetical protein
MESIWLVLVATTFLSLILLGSIAVTIWLAAKMALFYAGLENKNFLSLIEHYEKVLGEAAMEKKASALIPQIVECLNLNTSSIDRVEKTLGQLALRQASFVTRLSEKQTQVGEESPVSRLGNMTIAGARLPTTRTDSGAEGFVDETDGLVKPILPPTAREIAAMPPT